MVRNRAKIMKVEHKQLNFGEQWVLYNIIIAYSPPPPQHTHTCTKYQVCASKNS